MKKVLILGGVILIVILVNIFFWSWFSKDISKDELVVTEHGVMKKDWKKFVEAEVVQFDVPQSYIEEKSLTGVYWFEPKNQKVAIVLERLSRDKLLTLDEQIEKNILDPQKCSDSIQKGNFVIYEGCPYLSTHYTFIAIEYMDNLSIISLDHRQTDDEDIQYIINSLKEL